MMNVQLTNSRPLPKQPCSDLTKGPRDEYLKFGVRLYEASIKCSWKAAKAIFDEKPELVRSSITDNGETALHVAASSKAAPKDAQVFVTNLVGLMEEEDLALVNDKFNTALHVAAAAGNIDTVKIMVDKKEILLTIPGEGGQTLPLYAAARFGNYDVVKYLHEKSNDLCDDHGWTDQNRRPLLEKCIENDMFDVALMILRKYPKLGSGSALRLLARKPEAFETKSSTIWTTIKSAFTGLIKAGAPDNENSALQLLRFLWGDIVKKPKNEVDQILRGPPDLIKQDNRHVSRRVVQAMQLRKLINEYVAKMRGHQDSNIQEDQALKLQNLISECLVNLHEETDKIVKGVAATSSRQDNKPVSSKRDEAMELQNLIFKHIPKMSDETDKIIKSARKEEQARQLERVIFEHTEKISKEHQKIFLESKPARETHSSHVVFIAAEKGNASFIVELVRQYPELIWSLNDYNQSLFHIAVKHRHESIYNLLFEIGAMKDMIVPRRDPMDNNILHLVGKIATKKRLEDVSGVALQMQRELLWFQEVNKIIPPSYREQRNKDGLTPHELFTKEHKDLVTLGEKWMKETANQCMVVAALIATIVFATAFTVPSVFDRDRDFSFFSSGLAVLVFVVADATALLSSSASILMFLAIITSRYSEDDFLEKLPQKLIFGLATLFISIATMTLASGISFFGLYKRSFIWIPILICMFVLLPILLYIWLQHGLFFDVIRSTYHSRYLFKPRKNVLYYENPKM